jgi:hypothetical protein
VRTALLAALLAAAAPARAIQTDVGASAAEFLQIGAGARSLGMGDAYTAVADGPDAVYWNPAGLSRMTHTEATYSRTELPAGLSHDFFAIGMPSEFLQGTVAFALTRLSQGSLALVNASNQSQGSFSPHSEVYALAYGRSFGANDIASTSRDYFRENWNIPRADRPYENETEPWTGEIAAGASMKLISENLGTRSASAFAIDAGGLFRPTDLHELILGGAVRNLGTKLRFISESEPLPAELAGSVAYELRDEDWRVLPAFELDVPYAGNVYAKLGAEATKRISAGVSAAMRLGYTSVSVADLGFLSGLTAGVGLNVGKFSFDAAFQPMTVLGESFRIGVGWKF